MSQTYGALEKKVGNGKTVYMGHLSVPDVISGAIAIGPREVPKGSKLWPHEVKIRDGNGNWASLGNAKFERKNAASNWYLRMVIESPVIQNKLGKALWLRGFPDSDDKGDKPKGASNYDLVWGSGGGGKKDAPASANLDDEIPF